MHDRPLFSTRRQALSRRTVLRGAGAVMALPFLDAMQPAFARQNQGDAAPPQRLLAINLHLGFMAHNFFPKGSGKRYKPSKYLQIIDRYREDFTVISGTSHPGVGGAHESDRCFLTAAPGVGHAGFRNSVSLDQIVAKEVQGKTRFTHLPLAHRQGKLSLAWTPSGANIPPITSPIDLYAMMFIAGTKRQRAQRLQELRDGRSVLDAVRHAASDLSSELGQSDRQKLDQYFTSVRETERKFSNSEGWVHRPKPTTRHAAPKRPKNPAEFVQESALMYDMIHLALESDSSRVITYNQPNLHIVLPDNRVKVGYHALSHHNNDAGKMKQLEVIELSQMQALATLLERLTNANEAGRRLLDSTVLLIGSNFGNANNHDTRNMPIILAGGGFRHGQHLAFDGNDNTPLSNLFVSMLHRLGVDRSGFGSSTGTLTGLDAK